MKKMFAAALALSLMSSTAFAAPNDARGPQSQHQSSSQGQHQQNQNGQYQGPKGQQSRPQQIQQRPVRRSSRQRVKFSMTIRVAAMTRCVGPRGKHPRAMTPTVAGHVVIVCRIPIADALTWSTTALITSTRRRVATNGCASTMT